MRARARPQLARRRTALRNPHLPASYLDAEVPPERGPTPLHESTLTLVVTRLQPRHVRHLFLQLTRFLSGSEHRKINTVS